MEQLLGEFKKHAIKIVFGMKHDALEGYLNQGWRFFDEGKFDDIKKLTLKNALILKWKRLRESLI